MASPNYILQATTGLADCDDRTGACAIFPDMSWHVRTRCQLDGYQSNVQTQEREETSSKREAVGQTFQNLVYCLNAVTAGAENPLHQSTFQKVLSAEASHKTLHLQHTVCLVTI